MTAFYQKRELGVNLISYYRNEIIEFLLTLRFCSPWENGKINGMQTLKVL